MTSYSDINAIVSAISASQLELHDGLVLAKLIGILRVPYPVTKEAVELLESKNLIVVHNSGDESEFINVTSKALAIFRKVKKDNSDLAKELRGLYPPGMKDNKWPWRGTNESVKQKLDEFKKIYPDVTDQEIIKATKDYLERFDNDTSRSLLIYFIMKTLNGEKKSILADYVYVNREGSTSKKSSNFDQL